MNKNGKYPNMVFVLPDQFRRQAMGFWSKEEYTNVLNGTSDPVYTPNIDKFADEGIVFSQAISIQPVCSPYRGMLMSGRFPRQNGVNLNCKAGRDSSLREDIDCFTDILAKVGYSLGYIGKLHLDKPLPHFDMEGKYVGEGGGYFSDGSPEGATICWDMYTPKGPKRHEIDYWYSYGTFDVHKHPHYWDNYGIKHEVNMWSPKHEADKAIEYIKNTAGQRDLERPFCLFVGMNPPHSPYDSVDDTDGEMYEKYYSPSVVKDISDLLNRGNVTGNIAKDKVRYYFSHITGVDRQFGRILDAIDDCKITDNTIVVFLSDHGDMMGSHNLLAKNVPFEESIGVPFIIRYPDKLEHRIEDLLLTPVDIMPTILGLIGLREDIPEDVQGIDYSSLLISPEYCNIKKPESALYIFDAEGDILQRGLRTNRYTMVIECNIKSNTTNIKLYDNIQDPYQMHSLALGDINKETMYFLAKELGYWLKKANDIWYENRLCSDFIKYP
ncbi:MAG: sulfatase [Xylanivirga thermophila]|jgi:arylsulfatase A-like enzyme|uniref:sulfatase family protein n=1 Tax=Xylanivirga thermophila TaxID=2496273 RepID=UPI0039F62E5A